MYFNEPTKYDAQIRLINIAILRRENKIQIRREAWEARGSCRCCFYDGDSVARDLSDRNDRAEEWRNLLIYKADKYKLRVIKKRLKKLG